MQSAVCFVTVHDLKGVLRVFCLSYLCRALHFALHRIQAVCYRTISLLLSKSSRSLKTVDSLILCLVKDLFATRLLTSCSDTLYQNYFKTNLSIKTSKVHTTL